MKNEVIFAFLSSKLLWESSVVEDLHILFIFFMNEECTVNNHLVKSFLASNVPRVQLPIDIHDLGKIQREPSIDVLCVL